MWGLGYNLLLVPILIAGVFFLLSALLQWLWNLTVPELFNLKTLNFWQAMRLLLISALLFNGLGIRFFN